jgi:hypothetical protein
MTAHHHMPHSRRKYKTRRQPKPPAPPPGYVWFYWDLVAISTVERCARERMGNHDNLPRRIRDQNNADDISGPARRWKRRAAP